MPRDGESELVPDSLVALFRDVDRRPAIGPKNQPKNWKTKVNLRLLDEIDVKGLEGVEWRIHGVEREVATRLQEQARLAHHLSLSEKLPAEDLFDADK